ncbi:MAG: protein O-mannosyl-transferase family [Bacteroidia bacterium]
MTASFKKLNNIIGWLVFAVATFTYCSTIEPTASFWDCGEYIACAFKLEVGHPPGAPFFMLVGRFFALFGGGDPAHAGMMINIMSALCSSFSILFLFWSITRLAFKAMARKSKELSDGQQYAILGAGIIGALAYTFSDSFWFSAVEGEVYAMSAFFTAVVFWAILKWDEEDSVDPIGAFRWIVLISYLMGLSIGVHLLNLLVIPAICFIYYYKKYPFTWKSFFIAGFISVLILGTVQSFIIPKIVKFLSDCEVYFVNTLHFGFSSGTMMYFLLLIISLAGFIAYTNTRKESHFKIGFYSAILFALIVVISAGNGGSMFTRALCFGAILYAITKIKNKYNNFNVIMMSLATILIGYSSFFVLVIRSQANTPMDENDPENAPNMLSYLLREQYGDWPILYGNYYNAPTKPNSQFKDGDPIYAKDEKKGKYVITDDRKHSIPVYEEEFCTVFPRMWSTQGHHEAAYKYWGEVSSNHKTVMRMNEQTGENESIEIPTFWANLRFFFNYQVSYMYLRYFAWNFIGRQNDIQGMTRNALEGNAVTGIKAIDDIVLGADSSLKTHLLKNNKGSNYFYALPFLLGLLGFWWHYKNNKNMAWVVGAFFILTGIALIIYLNPTPYQPRERDYAYAGSFYAFAIWIGFGVLFLYEFLSSKTNAKTAAILATALSMVVPGIMAAEGWDDHDRSLRTLSRDVAIDYLQSCAPNAVLFTNGDNDTFPLWYAQEVEGIRTDVRVVNLSLLQTDWYINQMRRAAYDSKPVPFTIPPEKYVQGTRDVVYLFDKKTGPMSLKKAIDFVESDDPNNKLEYGNGNLDYIPSKDFFVNVDSMAVVNNKVVPAKDNGRIAKTVSWRLNRSYVTKNDLMVLDLIAHNDWKRPIYFAVTTGGEAYVGLEDYFQLEGLAYRFVPVKQNSNEQMQGGRVNTEVMYDNIMNKFHFGGMDKPGVNLDENCMRMAGNMRMQMSVLANALIAEGKNSKAKKVLDQCLEKMPDANVPYDGTIFTIAAGYYQLGDVPKANELSKKLFDIFEGDLRVYNALKGTQRAAFGREINQCKEILRRLTGLTSQFKQDALSKEFMQRIQAIIPAEELMPKSEPALN